MQDQETLHKQILDSLYDGVYFVDPERRIVYWNAAAERITGYPSVEVVGRCCHDNLLVHVDQAGASLCHGACPVAKTLADGESREADVFLRHRHGQRVPVAVRVTPLRDEKGAIVGAAEIFSANEDKLAALREIEALKSLALIDALTEIGNRRYAAEQLEAVFNEASRFSWPFGVMILDVDRFKRVNDDYGHEVGDQALRMTAKTIANSLRSFDVVGRWGGEEFLVVIKHADEDRLWTVAEKLRHMVESAHLTLADGRTLQITVSIGGTVARPGDTPAETLGRADRLLYRSKEAGRNRSTIA